jgi:asparagine synthase (glutamine-hydrolysing)
LLSRLVRDSGIKAVLTGEGADEMLAGYDIFREAEIRQFWSRQPGSVARPRLFERLYPYLARSPGQAKGMALEFWRQGIERAGAPGFSHDPRWRTTSQLKRFFSAELRAALESRPSDDVLRALPPEYGRWDSLARAQYLEVVTLLSGYLISSQGDRMLMAHSVEGRFPFLDSEVMEFCNGLPPLYKLAGLNEKFILKRAAKGRVPEKIIHRPKQPYRAPDAVSFVEKGAPAYVEEVLSESALRDAGLFDVGAARGLYAKCLRRAGDSANEMAFSNADNMGVVGLLSTQLLHREFILADGGAPGGDIEYKTLIDRVQFRQLQGTA